MVPRGEPPEANGVSDTEEGGTIWMLIAFQGFQQPVSHWKTIAYPLWK